jgi:phage terminase small subunit
MNANQRRFIDEYLIDLNGSQAAIRAGYSARSARKTAYDLLAKPEIAEAVQAAMNERAARTAITQDRVLKELAKIGFSDIRKAVQWQPNVIGMAEGEDGEERLVVTNQVQLVASSEIDDETAAAISSIGQDSRGGLKIQFHDKQAALVSMGRHLGMFKDKTELTGPDGGPVQVQRIERVIVDPQD